MIFSDFYFFLSYKLFGIYNATAIAMAASLFQVVFYRFKHQRYEKMHLISFGLIFVLGGATLFFITLGLLNGNPPESIGLLHWYFSFRL